MACNVSGELRPIAFRSNPSRMFRICSVGDALTVRRQFKNIVAAVIRRDRIDPGAGVFFEIGFAQITAVRLHEGVDLVRDLAFVESVTALFADQAQRVRQRRILEDVAFGRGAPFAVERVGFEKSAGQALCRAADRIAQ